VEIFVTKKKKKIELLTGKPRKAAIVLDKSQPEKRSVSMAAQEKKGINIMEEPRMTTVNEDGNKPQITNTDLSGGNLDKIREILFGAQMRTHEKRIARLEERLLKETTDLKDEIKKRFDSLEVYIKKEIDSLTDRVKVEERERAEAVRELSQEFRESSRSLDKRIVQLDDQTTRNYRELSQTILDKSKNLSDELRQRCEELSLALDREAQELRSDKTDRTALAALFTEVAMRLNNEFKIPMGE
jgi:hypothetical protein